MNCSTQNTAAKVSSSELD